MKEPDPFLSLDQARVGRYSHLWSLTAEEQFYLVWPWLILLLHRRYLPGILVSAILFAVVFRVAMVLAGQTHFLNLLLFGVTDALSMGALLAVVVSVPDTQGVASTFNAPPLRRLPALAAIGCVGAMAVSWHLIEDPIDRFKRRSR